jgi:tetratricopeptide (TPR) repeat protein
MSANPLSDGKPSRRLLRLIRAGAGVALLVLLLGGCLRGVFSLGEYWRQMTAVERLKEATELLRSKQTDGALIKCREAAALWPENATVHAVLGNILQAKGDPEAADCFRTALNLDPNNATAHNGLGVMLAKAERMDEALPHLRKAVAANADSSDTQQWLTECLLKAGDHEGALLAAREVVRLKPVASHSHYLIGRCYFELSNFELALKHQREAVRIDPNKGALHNNLAVTLTYLRRWKEAEVEYREAIRIKPTEALNWFGLGVTQYETDDDLAAVASITEAVRLAPKLARAHMSLGHALYRSGKSKYLALLSYLKAVELEPENPELASAYRGIGLVSQDRKEMFRAVKAFETAARLKPDDHEIRAEWSRAKTLLATGGPWKEYPEGTIPPP